MSANRYIACDLGAESGRVILGSLERGKLILEEIHRFPNGAVVVDESLRWDLPRLFDELKIGLRLVAKRGLTISSMSCDSWGVDYVLLDANHRVLAMPYHYRDSRTDGAIERAFARVPAEEIFAETGTQSIFFNTLYQLLAEQRENPAVLAAARQFLNIGDYFNYLLTGVAKAEESIASTTQLYNPTQRRWSASLVQKFGLPEQMFQEIVPSGTILGALCADVAAETGLRNVQVVASCSHDTAAAVAAVPAYGSDWAYLSSGTWSLLGIETPSPIISSKSREFDFTNEMGFGGKTLFLKNILGMWIVQECRRAWQSAGKEYGYDELSEMAASVAPLRSFIDTADNRFAKPDRMPEKIIDYCRETGQQIPSTPAEVIRCVLESLALSYRRTIDQLEEVSGTTVKKLHIVGGGSKNALLNQLTANATVRSVLAGPVECTAIGNVLIQAIALGHVGSHEEARTIVRDSFPIIRYEPAETSQWLKASEKYHLLAQ